MAGVGDAPSWAPDAPSRGRLLNSSHVAAVLGVRWKLTIRGYARGGAAGIVGLLIMLLFLTTFVGGLAVATGIGYVQLPRSLAVQLLFAVLALLYVGWILLPLLQYSLNEGLDVTRLQIYPITRVELMVSLVLATFFDIGTLAIVGFYVPIAIGWSHTPAAAAVTLVALALAYIHTVGASQLVVAALLGILRSRRFRDVAIVVFALLGAACSVGGQFLAQAIVLAQLAGDRGVRIDGYLQFTPPGMAARAIELASRGETLAALGWLAILALLIPALLAAWAAVLERGITAAETSGAAPSRRSGARGRRVSSAAAPVRVSSVGSAAIALARSRHGLLSPAALAVAGKDARFLWRDPQLKASLLGALFLLALVLVPLFTPSHARQDPFALPRELYVLYAPIPTLVVTLNLSLNSLGLERQALQMLYLYPVRPLDILWGKNLTVGAITVGAQVALALALAAFTGGWIYVPIAVAAGLAGVFVLMACGNVTSVLIPFRVRELRMGRNDLSSENGCLRAVLSMVTLLISAVLLLPVAAALVVPLVFQELPWLAVALPVAVLYGGGLHQLATRLIAPVMLRRGPEILAVTTRE